jgi:glyoxylase-like metal-dependent hydrolase (beta-lactamase superfamily II)/rhodanese-related sulfurtransferase
MEEKIITVSKLQEKLNKKEPVFILDVRPIDQRQEWKIAGSSHVDAYKQLNAGDYTALDAIEVPKNSTVVTVCAAGRTSLLAANLLERKGIHALSLEGGMKAWNYAWNTAALNVESDVKIIQVRRAAKGVLSYLVGSVDEAIVIDAALDPDVYIKLAQENGWKIKFVMDTHIHADFVSRSKDLANVSGAKHLLIDKAKVDFQFIPVSSGQIIKFGKSAVQFLHTPGHTWESTSLKLGDNVIFTGDTLFVDGIGRPDLKAEQDEAIQKAKSLYHSLNQILTMNPAMIVLPAHTSNSISFDNTLIGDSIENIKAKTALSNLDEDKFVNYALSRIPPTPPNYLSIAGINRKGSYEGLHLADLEAGGNHCAIA